MPDARNAAAVRPLVFHPQSARRELARRLRSAHFDVSMRMAELSLLPAVRNAEATTLIIADGTSCRHQVADGTRASGAREAVRVARVLERALALAAPPDVV